MPAFRRTLAVSGAIGAAVLALLALDRAFPPPLERLATASTLVVDREGELLRAFPSPEGTWRLLVRPEDVDPFYRALLLAVEDRRFFSHPGVDPLALARALYQALRHGRIVSGGSTLTMQLARLLEPRPRTLSAKLLEIARALQLEWRLGKSGVLAAYLALAPMGGNLEGVRAGSLAWFGREPRSLSPAEAALLVALPQAPSRLRPDLFPERAQRARDRVLERAFRAGLLDAADLAAARAAPIPRTRRAMPFHAPHLSERRARDAPPGSVVRTTLDGALQRALERLARAELDRLPPPVDLAVLVVEHATGAVRAWIGSGDWADPRRAGKVDLVRAVRSPGSTLKPFVYGLAFDAGIAHPGTLVRDRALRFDDYAPQNFDRGFEGDVTLREALIASSNLPAVLVADHLGPWVIAERLSAAGIRLVSPGPASAPALPLVLGGVGTRLVDLVAAYGALARDGTVVEPHDDPLRPAGEPIPLLAPPTAEALAAVLAEVPRPAGIPASTRRIAYKTGTSHRFRDGWAVGFDGGHVVGVWVGRADGAACAVCNGPGTAAPLLFRVAALLPDRPRAPPAPDHPLLGPPPPALARLAPRGLARVPEREQPPRITFPVDGSLLLLGEKEAVPLRATGGRPPYRWLVDDRPLALPRRAPPSWSPEEEGFARLRVVDALGRSDAIAIAVERREKRRAFSPTSPSRTRPEP
ncbi:MAG: penicillin-binding protein 1C [Geminicoccaceae bacterium]|nr:penicillin-binding protein 1C [Geminicoccaceae bacterium]MDW8340419.1 penicillin-binding protein 1C [Geminicoccaceae bacterium]